MTTTTRNPLEEITNAIGSSLIDLWQPRDWPHRRGDTLTLDLHSNPLTASSPGRRPVRCEHCNRDCLCIHDNILCWKCKGCFCFHCTGGGDPSRVCNMPAASLLERGFGTCFNCNEPLRSIALVDCFRTIIEAGGCFIGRNNPSVRGLDIGNTGQSLVAEAEDALTRARDAMSDESKKEYAISEFTHAINAINYLTSASNGKRLVLRAQDILIIAHHERAVLELEEGSSSELCKAIVKAYPRQSHRSSGKKDTVWHLTSTAFNSLFYPLPANTMVGSNIGVMLRVDMRDQSKNMAFQSDDWKRQLKIANMSANELSIIDMVKGTMPSTDGIDSRFDGLGGKWKGVLVHQIVPRAPGVVSINLEEHSFTSGFIVQFIHSFSTDISAREYTRLKTEMKEIGEETGPLNAKHDATLTKILKKMLCELEVSDFHKLHVLKGAHGPNLSISVVVTIGNVATKIFMQTTSESNLKPACYLAARAIAYLDGQLQEFKAADQVSMREALHHHPDLTLCAFCGKAGQPTLKKCSKCCLSKYCSVDCQKSHWQMKGIYGHKRFCKSVVSN